MKRFILFILMLAGLSIVSAEACSVCFGESDSSLAQGMNMGIMVLLLVITSVLFGVASFFVYLAKRTSKGEGIGSGQGLNPSFSQHTTNA